MTYDFLAVKDIPLSHISFWQSPIWQSILTNSHQAKEVFYFGNISGSWMLVEVRSIGLGLMGAFSSGIGSSQIADDWGDFVEELSGVLVQKGAIFLQIEPLDGAIPLSAKIRAPYKAFLTPHTRVLDLGLSLDDLLMQMHEKGRYNIRLATKRGVTVESVKNTPENLDIWMHLLEDTTSRDGFAGNNRAYYAAFLHELERADAGGLYFAYFDGQVIAAGIFVLLPERAIYYYGASSSDRESRKHMAPYLVQWTAILEAKKRRIPLYDFLGVADPSDPLDHLRGVTDFKERFGGQMVTLPSKVLLPLSWKYRIFAFLRMIKE